MKRSIAFLLAIIMMLTLVLSSCTLVTPDSGKTPDAPVNGGKDDDDDNTGTNTGNNDNDDDDNNTGTNTGNNDDNPGNTGDNDDDDRAAEKTTILSKVNGSTAKISKEDTSLADLFTSLLPESPDDTETPALPGLDFDPEALMTAICALAGEVNVNIQPGINVTVALKDGTIYFSGGSEAGHIFMKDGKLFSLTKNDSGFDVSHLDLTEMFTNVFGTVLPVDESLDPDYGIGEDIYPDEDIYPGEENTPAISDILQTVLTLRLDLSRLPQLTEDMLTPTEDGYYAIDNAFFKQYLLAIIDAVAASVTDAEVKSTLLFMKPSIAEAFQTLGFSVELHCSNELVNGIRVKLVPTATFFEMLAGMGALGEMTLPESKLSFVYEVLMDDEAKQLKLFNLDVEVDLPFFGVPASKLSALYYAEKFELNATTTDFALAVSAASEKLSITCTAPGTSFDLKLEDGVLTANGSMLTEEFIGYTTDYLPEGVESMAIGAAIYKKYNNRLELALDFNALEEEGGMFIKVLKLQQTPTDGFIYRDIMGDPTDCPEGFDPTVLEGAVGEAVTISVTATVVEENVLGFSIKMQQETTIEIAATLRLGSAPSFVPPTEEGMAFLNSYIAALDHFLLAQVLIEQALNEAVEATSGVYVYQYNGFALEIYYDADFELFNADIFVGEYDVEGYLANDPYYPLILVSISETGAVTFTPTAVAVVE